jgi:hypothetical protein
MEALKGALQEEGSDKGERRMARREKTYKGVLGAWEQLHTMLETNKEELPMFELSRVQFAEFLAKAKEAAQRQAIHTAGKQESSKELKELITEGERVATLLRQGLKTRYGIRSEKLVEFGLQPFRGRPRKAKPEEEKLPLPASPDPQTAG